MSNFILIIIQILYGISAIGLAIIGFNALYLTVIYLLHRNKPLQASLLEDQPDWPSVVVQLPIYNERYVVERLLEAVQQLDYPPDRLIIQLLDDSTDDTVAIAAAAIQKARNAGIRAEHVRRPVREGYKAGALAYGLEQTDAEFAAIFDADFIPSPDFLQRTIPFLMADENLGMAQTRVAHVNSSHNLITRAQALALDSHFVVEQTARNRGGYLMNFSGTAGVWRRRCIEDSGGWQHDTLSEDIDLSYRAQLRGWKMLYLPDVPSPAEIPPVITAFKQQQERWATGTVQCLVKLGPRLLLSSDLTWWQKIQGFIHLGGYLIYPLMIILMLSGLPLMITGHLNNLPLAGLGLAMFGPPIQALVTQRELYSNWKQRLAYYPILMFTGIGIAVSNIVAVIQGLSGRQFSFKRTPKFQVHGSDRVWATSGYRMPLDHTTWIELILALYAGVSTIVAVQFAPAMAPFMLLYMIGFGWVAGTGLWQTYGIPKLPIIQEKKKQQLTSNSSGR